MNEDVNEFKDAPDYDKNEDDGEDLSFMVGDADFVQIPVRMVSMRDSPMFVNDALVSLARN